MRRHPVLRVLVGVGLAAVLTSCQPPPAGITLSPPAATIEVGHTVALAARVRPAKANQLVSWASDAESVASVSSAGLVMGIGAGTATITANSVVDSKFTASAVITVVDGGAMLAPGGTVVGVDGVTLRASTDALDQPIAVFIERIPESEITEPLPAALTSIGHVYRVRADVGTLAADPGGFGFLLGLPVPADDVPDDLNVGFYLSGETVARWYPDHPPDEDVWEVVPGAYDADLGQWVVSLHVLLEEGYGIGLAAGAYFVEPEVPAAITTATGVSFHVRCRDEGVKDACSSANTEAYAAALAAAHDTFSGLGFPYPRIATRIPLGLGPPTAYLYGFTTDSKGVRRCNWSTARAYYNAVTANVVVCVNNDGFTSTRESTTWHEYFHAVQHAYPFMLQPVIRRLWILEGTARVAQGVLDAVRRGLSVDQLRDRHDEVHRFESSPLREVDVGLREQDGGIEYDAQDFWVFVGKWKERGVPWLRELLRVGYDPLDVGMAFYHTFDGLLLSEAYWAWAKNQAFEKTVDLGGTTFRNSPGCDFDQRTATAIEAHYRPSATASWSATLPPLTSAVFKVVLEPDIEDYVVTVSVEDDSVLSLLPHDDVMVKFYDAAEADSSACTGREDARTHDVTVPQGTTRTIYTLVSNTRYGVSLPLRVDLKVARAGVVETVDAIRGQVDDLLGFGAFAVGLYGGETDVVFSEDRRLASGTISATGEISIPLPALTATHVDWSRHRWCGRTFEGVFGGFIVSDSALDFHAYTARAVYERVTPRAVDGEFGYVRYLYSLDGFHEVCTGDPVFGATDVDVHIVPGWNVVVWYYDDVVGQMFLRSGEPDFDVPWLGPFAFVE